METPYVVSLHIICYSLCNVITPVSLILNGHFAVSLVVFTKLESESQLSTFIYLNHIL